MASKSVEAFIKKITIKIRQSKENNTPRKDIENLALSVLANSGLSDHKTISILKEYIGSAIGLVDLSIHNEEFKISIKNILGSLDIEDTIIDNIIFYLTGLTDILDFGGGGGPGGGGGGPGHPKYEHKPSKTGFVISWVIILFLFSLGQVLLLKINWVFEILPILISFTFLGFAQKFLFAYYGNTKAKLVLSKIIGAIFALIFISVLNVFSSSLGRLLDSDSNLGNILFLLLFNLILYGFFFGFVDTIVIGNDINSKGKLFFYNVIGSILLSFWGLIFQNLVQEIPIIGPIGFALTYGLSTASAYFPKSRISQRPRESSFTPLA